MSPAQIHLMLNHAPVVGMVFTLALLAVGLVWRKQHVLRIALATAIAVAALSVPVFMSGKPAEELVEKLPGVTEAVIEPHERAATIALDVAIVLGLFAIASLLWFRRRSIPRAVATVALVISLGAVALMTWTAHLGGQIRHTEIRGDPTATEGARTAQHDAGHD